MRRAIQVLGIALMAAGFLLDNWLRRRQRPAGMTADRHRTSRLPVALFGSGAVLLVLASV